MLKTKKLSKYEREQSIYYIIKKLTSKKIAQKVKCSRCEAQTTLIRQEREKIKKKKDLVRIRWTYFVMANQLFVILLETEKKKQGKYCTS